MATSGYTNVVATKTSSGNAADTLQFSWSRSSYSIADNTTTVYWELKLIAGAYGYISSSVSKNWSVTVNGKAYSGSNTIGISANTTRVLASGSTVIKHNDDGSKTFTYSFSQYFGINFNGSVGTVSGSGSGTLDPIARLATITSAPNFTDTDSPTIYFSNPAGSAVTLAACISWTGADDIAYRSVSSSATSYTFTFTEEELNKLYAATLSNKTSRTVTFYIRTTINGKHYTDTEQRTFTVSDCAPTLEPTVTDMGSGSFLLTNDRSSMIRYFNYPEAAFNATAKKGASITSRTVTCGSQKLTAAGNTAQFNNVDTNEFVFTITDNRGHTVSKTVTVTPMIEYTPPTCYMYVEKDLQNDNSVNINLRISGSCFVGSFGAVDNDVVVEYRCNSDTWTAAELVPSDDGKYISTPVINVSDYTAAYTVQARIRDSIWTWGVNSHEEIVKVMPVFDWGENDFNFNVPVHGKGGFTYDIPIRQDDVDSMLTSGIYYMGTQALNKPGPFHYNGWLEVYTPVDGGLYSYQKFTDYLGDKYERWRNDGVWGTWKSLTIKTTSIPLQSYTLSWTKSGSGMYYATVSSLTRLGLSGHTILGIYAGSWGGFTATSLIMPYIQSDELRVMATAATTPSEYTIIISYQ